MVVASNVNQSVEVGRNTRGHYDLKTIYRWRNRQLSQVLADDSLETKWTPKVSRIVQKILGHLYVLDRNNAESGVDWEHIWVCMRRI